MSAKIVHLPAPRPTICPDPGRLLSDSVPFMSMCPTCNEPRLQMGYSPWGLHRRLNGNRHIEAHCAICHRFWPITNEERERLARELEHLRLS
jgi:hypothetical protein